MKKLFLVLTILLFVTVSTSCVHSSNNTSEISSNSFSNTSEIPITEFGEIDFNIANYNNAAVVSQDEGFYYLRDKVNFSEFYKNAKVDTGTITATYSSGNTVYPTLIDDSLNLFCAKDSEENQNGEIGVYNIKTKQYKKLMVIPLGSQVALKYVDEDYLVWTESVDNSNWYKTRLHLYDRKNNTDKSIYTYTINPETGTAYSWNWSIPVILKGVVYFDDIIGMDGNRFLVSLFAYDIQNEKVTEIKKQAKWPIKINENTISWNEQCEKEGYVRLVSFDGNQKKTIAEFYADSSMEMLDVSADSIICTNPLYSEKVPILNVPIRNPDYDIFDCTGVQIYKEGKAIPILITKESQYIGWPNIVRDLACFDAGIANKKPVFYDIKNDKIVELDIAEYKRIYTKLISNKYLIYICQVDESENLNSERVFYCIDLDTL